MSRVLGPLAGLPALLLVAALGCTPAGSTGPAPTNRPAATDSGKAPQDTGSGPRPTAPEHIPSGS